MPPTANESAAAPQPVRRRRGRALEEAIRSAVLDLVIEQGVSGVTMEAVAARARTSKPVLYRRWESREMLLRDTLVPLAMEAIPHVDTGSYRNDMLAVLHGWAGFFERPSGVIAAAIVGAMPHDPELAVAFRDGVIGWRKQAMAELLERGILRGDVRADIPIELARELGQAVLWHRFLVTGDAISRELIRELVDEVLVPYATPRE